MKIGKKKLLTLSLFLLLALVFFLTYLTSLINLYIYTFFACISALFIFYIDRSRDLKNPFYIFSFLYIVFLLFGVSLLTMRQGFHPKVASLILLGFYLYLSGYSYASSRKINRNKVSIPISVSHRSLDWPYFIYAGIFFIGVIGIIFFYFQAGGIPILDRDMVSERHHVLQGRGYGLQLFKFIAIPFYLLVAKDSFSSKRVFIKPITISIGLVLILGLATIGFRTYLFETIVTPMIIYFYAKRKNLKAKQLLPIAIFLVILSMVISSYRKGEGHGDNMLSNLQHDICVNPNNIKHIVTVFPAFVPYKYGETYFTKFRMIRPGPDKDFTMQLSEWLNLGDFEGGTTPSIVGEWYLNFGYLGIIGMFFMGMLALYLHRKLSNTDNIFSLVKWSLIAVGFHKSLIGGISNVLLQLTLSLIVVEIISISTKMTIFARNNTEAAKTTVNRSSQ